MHSYVKVGRARFGWHVKSVLAIRETLGCNAQAPALPQPQIGVPSSLAESAGAAALHIRHTSGGYCC